jgi:FkbM family methyltransferase
MKTVNHLGHTILVDPLRGKKPIVFDCGSNAGEFAGWVKREFGARVYGYEPDPRLFKKLTHERNDDAQNPEISFFQKAIAGREGTARLHLGNSQCSSLYYPENAGVQTELVTLSTLEAEMSRLGVESIDLLKLDIEGAELDVLQTTPAAVLRRISQITTEFHDFLQPGDVPAIRATIARVNSLGFRTLFFSTRTYGDVLFVNRERIALPTWQRASLLVGGKYLPGLRRTLARYLTI